jgi:molybdate transport system substrate-binding protein
VRAAAVATATSLALLPALLLAGCAGAAPGPQQTEAADPLSGSVTVLAAASLTEVDNELAARFEKLHPRVTITLSYGCSSALAGQIVQGAPADLFATANEATMKTVTDAGLTDGAPIVYATNMLQLIVPPGNPGHVTSLRDLTRPGVKVALCDSTVPCGAAAATLFATAGITVKPVTLEQDVKAVLTKVELDEVDAGLVYVSDATTAGDKVDRVAVPQAATVINRYPIALLTGSTNKAAARAFERFILSTTGLAVLKKAGFGAP